MINKIDIASKNWAEDYITQHGSRFINMLREAFIAGFKKGVFCSEPKWIPVAERLPKPYEFRGDVRKHYLVQNEYGDMRVARYDGDDNWEEIYAHEYMSDKVVAWCPLPEPYKGGGG